MIIPVVGKQIGIYVRGIFDPIKPVRRDAETHAFRIGVKNAALEIGKLLHRLIRYDFSAVGHDHTDEEADRIRIAVIRPGEHAALLLPVQIQARVLCGQSVARPGLLAAQDLPRPVIAHAAGSEGDPPLFAVGRGLQPRRGKISPASRQSRRLGKASSGPRQIG